MKKIKICLIGKGTVGTAFLELLQKKRSYLKNRYEVECIITTIFERERAWINRNGLNLDTIISKNKTDSSLWKNGVDIQNDLKNFDIDICIESTPTNPKTGEPAFSYIIKALNNNMDVITSNKGPFCLYYRKLKELAKKRNCLLKYEATVGSGIPILSMSETLEGNTLTKIKAILNGTSNYILSRMSSERIPFLYALKEAQELGYAESDPNFDIQGYDAGGKLVILINELFGLNKSIKDVQMEGIEGITPNTIELAESDGFIIKPIALFEDKKLFVGPRLIKRNSLLNISGTLNAIKIYTEEAGPLTFLGRGAGGFEAASAMFNDLIYIIRKRIH
jgi:homoserine dehydrogenase